jgi:hypothetical protein
MALAISLLQETSSASAGDVICTHFLKNDGAEGKIFEEKLFILTI